MSYDWLFVVLVILFPPCDKMKGFLLALVVALLFVGGCASLKNLGKKTVSPSSTLLSSFNIQMFIQQTSFNINVFFVDYRSQPSFLRSFW